MEDFVDKEEILKKLDEYSESFVDNNSKLKKKQFKKKKNRPKKHEQFLPVSLVSKDNNMNKHSKNASRKKRRKLNTDVKNENTLTECNSFLIAESLSVQTKNKVKAECLGGSNQKLQKKEFKAVNFHDTAKKDETENNVKMVQAQSSNQKLKKKEPEVIEFHDPAKRSAKKRTLPESRVQSADHAKKKPGPSFNFERARHEIKRLGIDGLPTELKNKATTDLLIQLGAKPKKNTYYNYKEYQHMQKSKKEDLLKEQEKARNLGDKGPKALKPNRRKKNKDDIGEVDGQIGRYKSGVQHVHLPGSRIGSKHK